MRTQQHRRAEYCAAETAVVSFDDRLEMNLAESTTDLSYSLSQAVLTVKIPVIQTLTTLTTPSNSLPPVAQVITKITETLTKTLTLTTHHASKGLCCVLHLSSPSFHSLQHQPDLLQCKKGTVM